LEGIVRLPQQIVARVQALQNLPNTLLLDMCSAVGIRTIKGPSNSLAGSKVVLENRFLYGVREPLVERN
jgi:hypothetical protein